MKRGRHSTSSSSAFSQPSSSHHNDDDDDDGNDKGTLRASTLSPTRFITILKTNTPYPSRKIRRIRACPHQRPQRNKLNTPYPERLNMPYLKYGINVIFWKISSMVPTPINPQYAIQDQGPTSGIRANRGTLNKKNHKITNKHSPTILYKMFQPANDEFSQHLIDDEESNNEDASVKEEYDIWAMEMEHYLEYIDNDVWKVIQNGNSKKIISTRKDGIVRILSPVTAVEIQAVEKERKAKNILLMAIPKEHMRRFHGMDDAKEIWEAIRTRFGGNANSKKMQKALEAHGAEVSTEDANHKFLRSLPPAWFNLAMTMRTKPEVDTLSIDDFKSSTNKVKSGFTGAYSTCTPSTSSTNIPEKEVLLIAMIAIRMKKFYKKTGRRVCVDGKTHVGFDKKKLEYFNCHNTCHLARECTAKGTRDGKKKRDSFYQHQEAGKQEKNQMGLLTMNDRIVNWGEHIEVEETNHALMAISSITEVSLCSKTCIDSYNTLKTLCDEQMNQLGDQEAQILAYSQAVKKLEAQLVTFQKQQLSLNEKLTFQANEIYEKDEKLKRYRRIGMKAVKEKEQLQKTLDSWKDSSKNLWRLINSGMSSNSKVGLGFEIQSNNEVLSYEEEMNFSVFNCSKEDSIGKPLYSRFTKTNDFKGVPHPLSGDYTPKPQEEIDDSLYVYGKKGPQKPEISVSDDNSSEHSTCQSNDSEGSCGNTSEHSFDGYSKLVYGASTRVAPNILPGPKASHQFRWKFLERFALEMITVATIFGFRGCLSERTLVLSELWNGVDLLKGKQFQQIFTHHLHEMAFLASPNFCLMDRASYTSLQGKRKRAVHSKRASHPPKPVPNSKQRLHLLHMDLCGPMRIASINGKRYVLVIVDDYSRYTWVVFLRSKDEAPEEIKTFLKRITVLLQAPVIIVRTDNGTEFKNQVLQEYFKSVGISHQASSVRTPQQNGVVERRNRTLVEAARTMLIFSRAPLFLWAEAIATACYTQNRSIIHRRFDKTPYELINGRKPDISFLHVFGALCYPKNDREDIGKLGAKGLDLPYAPSTITTQPRTPQQNGVAERMNRTLIEAARTMLANSLLPTAFWAEAVSTACYNFNRVRVTKPQNKTPYELLFGHKPIINYIRPFGCHVTILNTLSVLGKFDGKSDEGFLVDKPNVKGVGYRWMFDIDYLTDSMNYIPVSLENQANPHAGASEVTNSACTSQTPSFNASEEKDEDKEEILTKLQQDKKASSTDTSEDNPKILAFRRELEELALKHLGKVSETKPLTVLLQFNTDEEVYVSQPPGFVDPDHPKKVYKVVKALYGLHQAPRAWYATLSTFLEKHGYKRGTIDKTLFIKRDKKDIMLDKYVAEILKKFDLVNVKTAITPMETKVALTKDEEAVDVDVHLYRSMIGGSNLDRKSTTGGCQFLGQRLISWQCKKQTIVATSTTEAEYVAAANCCGQVLWVQNQLLDYGFNFMNTKIHIDNESTICIVKNPVYHSKTKHIEIRHHFIRDCYEKKLISVEKIHTDLNVADFD
ncbi:retrovirus-related pol polyprotein from transposon TNT 1-94 [Tanacetum coccineum]